MKAIGKAISARRALLATLSGVTLIAVVLVATISLSQRQPQRRASVTATPGATSVSYQVYASTSATPGASSSTAQAKASSHSSPTATPAVSAGGVISREPAPSIAWPVTGDFATVAGSYVVTTTNSVIFTPQIEMRNAGTTTWLGGWTYYLGCISNCMNGYSAPTGDQTPGQTAIFGPQLYAPQTLTIATYYTQWAMFHSGVQFGEIATVKITVTVAIPLGVDPAPGCDSSDMTWTVTGGACANGGLALTTNTAQEPAAALHNAPAGFDSANYMITVHADFTSAPGAWVRLVAYNSSSQCDGQGVDVRSDGGYRNVIVSNCVVTDGGNWTATPPGPSPIGVTLVFQNSIFTFAVNGQYIEDGGVTYATGYPVISAGGADGSVVTVTNAELDTPVSFSAQWNVLQNRQQRM